MGTRDKGIKSPQPKYEKKCSLEENPRRRTIYQKNGGRHRHHIIDHKRDGEADGKEIWDLEVQYKDMVDPTYQPVTCVTMVLVVLDINKSGASPIRGEWQRRRNI